MNRRGFLSKLPFAFAAPMLMVSEGLEKIDHPNYQYRYKGYMFRWTGWKMAFNQDWGVGQWLAVTESSPKKRIYSSTPGACGYYYPGQIFDISLRSFDSLQWKKKQLQAAGSFDRGADFDISFEPQVLVNSMSSEEMKNDEQAKALRKLMVFIDRYGDKDPNVHEMRS